MWHLVHTRIPCWSPVLFTRVHSPSFVEPESNTMSTICKCNIQILVRPFRSQWWRSVARWWKGAAFTEKMTVEFRSEEFTARNGEPRISEPNKQSNDPPPEFTDTKPSEFKSCRKKVTTVAFVHARSSSIARASWFEQADRPSLGCL